MRHIWVSVLTFKNLVISFVLFTALQGESKLLVKPLEAIKTFSGDSSPAIKEHSLLLTKDELIELRKLSRTPCDDGLFKTFLLNSKNNAYFIPLVTQRVRSKTQTTAVFINSKGQVEHVEIIAFNEPPKYTPNDSLKKQFKNKTIKDKMQPHKDIIFISGATLTAEATSKSVRIALALWQLKHKKDSSK